MSNHLKVGRFADVSDQASAYEENLNRVALMNRKPEGPKVSPRKCLTCGSDFTQKEMDEGRRWCNADCRDLWERSN